MVQQRQEERVSRSEIEEAMKELEEEREELGESALDRFLILLTEWDQWEAARLRALERFRLLGDLPGYNKESLAEQYAFAKKMVLRIEDEMVGCLAKMSKDEADEVLSGRGFVVRLPDATMVVSVRAGLAARLLTRMTNGKGG